MIFFDLIVVGGGAAGVFAAICAKTAYPSLKVCLLEKTAVLLAKVRVSGGGRCNVTHGCFDLKALCKNYPRGEKELLGPLHRFGPKDIMEWFESRGVKLKIESDGRVFPKSDHSETIIAALFEEAKSRAVEIQLLKKIESIEKHEEGFKLLLKEGVSYFCKRLLLATGSSLKGFEFAKSLGHTIQDPVPSLFTFNVPTSSLKGLSGVSVDQVELSIEGSSLKSKGALLITHFGFSGPAALKLSAWGARFLFEKEYRVKLLINWVPAYSFQEILAKLTLLKTQFPKKGLTAENPFYLPKNLWKKLAQDAGLEEKEFGHLSLKDLRSFAEKLHADAYFSEGKTTHKEEFVTCGGVTLKEVDFKTMESKKCPGLFFAGEILDIDGVTGGFNFQNAWTTAFIAGISKT